MNEPADINFNSFGWNFDHKDAQPPFRHPTEDELGKITEVVAQMSTGRINTVGELDKALGEIGMTMGPKPHQSNLSETGRTLFRTWRIGTRENTLIELSTVSNLPSR